MDLMLFNFSALIQSMGAFNFIFVFASSARSLSNRLFDSIIDIKGWKNKKFSKPYFTVTLAMTSVEEIEPLNLLDGKTNAASINKFKAEIKNIKNGWDELFEKSELIINKKRLQHTNSLCFFIGMYCIYSLFFFTQISSDPLKEMTNFKGVYVYTILFSFLIFIYWIWHERHTPYEQYSPEKDDESSTCKHHCKKCEDAISNLQISDYFYSLLFSVITLVLSVIGCIINDILIKKFGDCFLMSETCVNNILYTGLILPFSPFIIGTIYTVFVYCKVSYQIRKDGKYLITRTEKWEKDKEIYDKQYKDFGFPASPSPQ